MKFVTAAIALPILALMVWQAYCPKAVACHHRGGDYTIFDGCMKTVITITPI